jgi:hypothetical protein
MNKSRIIIRTLSGIRLSGLASGFASRRKEWKAWSQNLGHGSESTTFVGYGHVPLHRQAEIMRALAEPRRAALPDGLDIAALEAFVNSAKASRTV